MAATYKGILTNNGKALIANATVNNKINYSHIAVGDGNGSVPTPLETRTALVNEKARIALNVVEINPNNTNQIVCEAIIPSNIGGFFIRELGLFAGDTMVVNASYPPTYKPLADEGAAREIAIKLVINIQNAEVIALYLDDSLIYATREWVNNNYIRRNEIVDNLTTDDAAKPLSARQGKALQDNKFDKSGGILSGEININTGESSAIKTVINAAGSITVNKPNELAAINHAISFNWYKTEFQIGNVRSASQDSDGFGITKKNNELLLLVKENGDLYNFGDIRCSKYIYAAKFIGELGGNASSASKLQNSRNISFNGAATGSIDFDGSANASCLLTLANSGVIAGTYASTIQIPQINVNNKGLITSVSQQNIRSATTGQTGVVQLTDDLATDDSSRALTARQGKALQDNKFDKSGGILSGEININTGESSAIKTVINAAGSITVNKPNELAAINHAISFNWYKTEFQIGNVRSASQDSDGFGITKKNNELLLLVKENGDLYNFGDIRCSKYIYAAKFIGELGGNASSASKLQNSRNISFNGAATGSIDFDGSANASCLLTLANSGVIAGTYASTIQIPQINVNDKGLLTSVSQQNIRSATTGQSGVVQLADDLTTNDSSKALTARQGKALQDNKFDKSGGTLSGEININTGESSAIKTVVKSGASNGDINHAISFNWYDTEYLIGNIRGGSTDSIGFGIKSKNGNTIFVVDDSSTLYATQFTGNATTATKLQTARNIALSGAVSGSANFDGSGNITISTTANNAIGVGQSWSDVTSSRARETTYLNSTGKPLMVQVCFSDTYQAAPRIEVIINGVSIINHTYDSGSSYGSGQYAFIVPVGQTYRVNTPNGAVDPFLWAELR
ncbi:phage tail protein [Acinetobacter ursingii]|uniref:phage tail-collar fiber domain-containing protein n=1 Tax=Acinetobacter ursingii TaxID=108980 RepID=UPI003AF7A934